MTTSTTKTTDARIKARSVTLADVAREAGVTKGAVSFALNGREGVSEATRKIVVEAAQRLGYEPNLYAQGLSNGRSNNTIGLFNLWLDLGVATQKIQIIQSTLNGHGFNVPIYGLGTDEFLVEGAQATAIASIRRQKPRALVCFTLGLHRKTLEQLRRYQDEGGIVVAYDYPVDLDCDRVLFDREDNTYRGARHLLELGHRDIGFATHGFTRLDNPRVPGFARALGEFGAPFYEAWVLSGRDATGYVEGGYVLAHEYLKLKKRPTALSIVNDTTAIVFLTELERAGLRCPQDISVVGHDNHALSQRAAVPLTTVSHPTETIAHEVTQLLLSRLSGEYNGPSRHVTVRGEIIRRHSTAAPKNNFNGNNHA